MYLHRNKWKQRFCGGHLGLQDDSQKYKFENVPIGFAKLKNVYLDTPKSVLYDVYKPTYKMDLLM